MRSRVGVALGGLMVLVGLFVLVGIVVMATPAADSPDDRAVAPPPACSGNETRPTYDFHPWAQMPRAFGYELTVNESTVGPGAPLRFSIRNVANTSKATDGKAKYVLQEPKAAGWRTLTRFRGPAIEFDGTGDTLDPGEGYEWTFRANATGFSTDRYVVCESLAPGFYRFVYLGGDQPLSVRFEISDPSDDQLQDTP